MLQGKKILLGISGSIAAFKTAALVRLLIKEGAEVRVIMTPAAAQFVTPLTLSTLSRNPVLTDLSDRDVWADHVHLGRWADIMLLAPLSCNTLAKMANGLCDNLLMAVYLSATCPVAFAPAMDEDMWLHISTKENLDKLKQFGNHLIPVAHGELASGLVGEGRMAEPESIVHWLQLFFEQHLQFKGKQVLITAGPTYEPIDPVRFIGNHSSGKMGIALAEAFAQRGARVCLILGPTSLKPSHHMEIIRVNTADEMYQAAVDRFASMDIAVLAAAVADFSIDTPAAEKIKKSDASLQLPLTPTKDILKQLGAMKRSGQCLVGFALETNNEREHALKKMREKNTDMIVLNSLRDEGAGFGHDSNRITIFDKSGNEQQFDLKSKTEVAGDILDMVFKQIS